MNNLVIYIHINKNAGTFLKSYIAHGVNQSWKVIQTEEEIDEFNSSLNKGQLRAIGGHLKPSFISLLDIKQPHTYVVSLREPVDRTQSVHYFNQGAYQYMKVQPEPYQKGICWKAGEFAEMGLEKCIDILLTPEGWLEWNDPGITHANRQCQWLDPQPGSIPTQGTLERVIHFIETSVSYICLDTEMRDMGHTMSDRFGWTRCPECLRIHRPNQNDLRNNLPPISQELKLKIEQLNYLDMKLYSYAIKNAARINSRPITWITPTNKGI